MGALPSPMPSAVLLSPPLHAPGTQEEAWPSLCLTSPGRRWRGVDRQSQAVTTVTPLPPAPTQGSNRTGVKVMRAPERRRDPPPAGRLACPLLFSVPRPHPAMGTDCLVSPGSTDNFDPRTTTSSLLRGIPCPGRRLSDPLAQDVSAQAPEKLDSRLYPNLRVSTPRFRAEVQKRQGHECPGPHPHAHLLLTHLRSGAGGCLGSPPPVQGAMEVWRGKGRWPSWQDKWGQSHHRKWLTQEAPTATPSPGPPLGCGWLVLSVKSPHLHQVIVTNSPRGAPCSRPPPHWALEPRGV